MNVRMKQGKGIPRLLVTSFFPVLRAATLLPRGANDGKQERDELDRLSFSCYCHVNSRGRYKGPYVATLGSHWPLDLSTKFSTLTRRSGEKPVNGKRAILAIDFMVILRLCSSAPIALGL
jgi:hypothetical protein